MLNHIIGVQSAIVLTVLLLYPNILLAEVQGNTHDKLEKLPGRYGYAIIHLDVAGIAPSITYTKLLNSAKPQKLTLKDSKKGFRLLPMPAGQYQITHIETPYYNLPYKVNTKEDKNWRFSIKKGKLNYIGNLIIDKERGTDSVNVKLLNRIATELTSIKEEFSELLTHYPLIASDGYDDVFLMEYEAK